MIFVAFFIGLATLSVAFFHFDKILKFQYVKYRGDWENAGKAGGFFWNPEESPFFSGSLQRSVRVLSWTFGNEEWMLNHPNVVKSAKIMRVSIFFFWLIWILLVVFGISE